MNYFKNEKNEIFSYDDKQIKYGCGKNLTPITEDEKDELLKPTKEQLLEQQKQQTISRLVEIDTLAVRPTRAIKVAELQGVEPSNYDIDKLVELENEANLLRESLV